MPCNTILVSQQQEIILLLGHHFLHFQILKSAFHCRRPHAFVGLRNGGATCYMNSVFQQLFMQPSIRRSILSAAEPKEDAKALQDNVFYQLQVNIHI